MTKKKPMHLAVYLTLYFAAWMVGAVVANSISAIMGMLYAEATASVVIGYWTGKRVVKNKQRDWIGIIGFPIINLIVAPIGVLAIETSDNTQVAVVISLIITFLFSCALFALLNIKNRRSSPESIELSSQSLNEESPDKKVATAENLQKETNIRAYDHWSDNNKGDAQSIEESVGNSQAQNMPNIEQEHSRNSDWITLGVYILIVIALIFTVVNLKPKEVAIESIDEKHSPALNHEHYSYIIEIIEAFKVLDKDKISSLISYPLEREYPIPSIDNKNELLLRFNEVFDYELIQLISNSDVDRDWTQLGWRGIMFANGKLWLNGELITKIHHQTELEKRIKEGIIKQQKLFLHKSINTFINPILEWKTEHYRIRIDNMDDNNIRYAAWYADKKTSSKPNIVLYNGTYHSDGSGGNHSYTFTSGEYIFRCYVTVLGNHASPPGYLEVLKSDVELHREPVLEVVN